MDHNCNIKRFNIGIFAWKLVTSVQSYSLNVYHRTCILLKIPLTLNTNFKKRNWKDSVSKHRLQFTSHSLNFFDVSSAKCYEPVPLSDNISSNERERNV